MTVGRRALLWLLFFLICTGLGYPALNRYDPAKIEGTSDVAEYREIVMGRQPQNAAAASGASARLAQSENYTACSCLTSPSRFIGWRGAACEPGTRPSLGC